MAERDGPSMEGSPGETARGQDAWRRLQTRGMGVLSCPVTVGDANDGHLYGYLEFEGGPQYPSILFYLLGMFHFYSVCFFFN